MNCTNCGVARVEKDGQQWWNLTNYHHVSGYFCTDCYELVAHDAYGNPKDVRSHAIVAVKQRIQNANRQW
jgi:hypothetical protein